MVGWRQFAVYFKLIQRHILVIQKHHVYILIDAHLFSPQTDILHSNRFVEHDFLMLVGRDLLKPLNRLPAFSVQG